MTEDPDADDAWGVDAPRDAYLQEQTTGALANELKQRGLGLFICIIDEPSAKRRGADAAYYHWFKGGEIGAKRFLIVLDAAYKDTQTKLLKVLGEDDEDEFKPNA